MSSLNKVMLIGNLGSDPEIRTMHSGGKSASLRIATSESWRDKNSGERKEKTEWHTVVIFNESVVNFAEKYIKKGNKVYIEGELQTRKWKDQNNNDRYTTEVVLKNFSGKLVNLTGKNDHGNHTDSAGTSSSDAGSNQYKTQSAGFSDLNDEVPF